MSRARFHLVGGLTAALLTLAAGPGWGRQVSSYPVAPVALPDTAEIELALSAAPPELSDSADVYSVAAGRVRRIRQGTGGAACMVGRDLHAGSLYPMCFNPEAARTTMQRELLQLRLRSLGVTEDSVARAVETAYRDGSIPRPERMAIVYMMSPRQVLFSSPQADGVRVGAWHPHVMIAAATESARDLGFSRAGRMAGVFQIGVDAAPENEFIVLVSHWADGSPESRRP